MEFIKRNRVFSFLLIFIIISVAGGVVGCSTPTDEPDGTPDLPALYKFGVDVSLSGAGASLGQSFLYGIQMAVDDINSQGGVDGILLEYNATDNALVNATALTNFQRFVSIDKVPFVFGMGTGPTSTCAPLATESETVFMNGGGVAPSLAGISPYVFHDIVNGVLEAKAMAYYMYDAGIRDVIEYGLLNSAGIGVFDAFTEYFEELGGTIVGREGYTDLAVTDFNSDIQKIMSYDADAVYLAVGGTQNALFLKQARQFGMDLPFYSCSFYAVPDNLTVAEGYSEGDIFTNSLFPVPGNQRSIDFQADFEAKYGFAATSYAANGYDAVFILADAIEYSIAQGWGYTGSGLQKAILELTFDRGVTGTTTFNEDGTCNKSLGFFQVQDNTYQVIGIWNFETMELEPIS